MRVLVNDEDDLLTAFDTEEIAVENVITYDEDKEFHCPCLYVSTADFKIFIPMSAAQARQHVLDAYATGKTDLSAYYNRTYYNPDSSDIKELQSLISSRSVVL